MRNILVSVVIPTRNRPHLLPRAVASALGSAGNTEVIVVPNGGDTSHAQSLATFGSVPHLRVLPIAAANANAARNHGLAAARGEFVRFLDDDDELDDQGATRQVQALERSGQEISTGAVDVVREDGGVIRRMALVERRDLFCSLVRPGRICLPTAHLFRRSALVDRRWDETRRVEQDTDWMFRLAAEREWDWQVFDGVVGRWTHHEGERTSRTITRAMRGRMVADMMLAAARTLEARGALDARRADAIAEGLWTYGHAGFHLAPFFWTRRLGQALRLAPARLPDDPAFRDWPLARLHPLLAEWLAWPKRALAHSLRQWTR